MKKNLSCCIIIVFGSLLLLSYLVVQTLATPIWNIQTIDSEGHNIFQPYKRTSIALDSNDRPHIGYSTNGYLKYARWTGSTWDIQTVEGGAVFASLALDSNDRPHISYCGYSPNYDLKYARWDGSAWDIQTVDGSGITGYFTSIVLDSNDRPHISYYDFSNGDLKYAQWTGSAWDVQTVDSTGDVGEYTSLALDSYDKPHISYFAHSGGDLRYAQWTGSAWDIQTVDALGTVGWYTSIVLDSNDRPHISYYNYVYELDGDLKYAQWTGSAWSVQTVDSAGNVGMYTSIVLDSNGRPHISYGYNDLKYAQWTGSAWDIETVDSGGTRGYFTSIVLDSNDRPHISYYDILGNNLKYATLAEVDQYEVTFSQIGVGSDFGGTVVTIDSVNYEVTDLPVTFTWNKDSSHTFSYASPLDAGSGKKYLWTGTSGLSNVQSGTLVVSEPGSVTANYMTKFLVQYAANTPVTLPTDEWVLSGQAATGVFPTEEISGGTKYVFVSDDRPSTITAPTTITATYDTYYKVTFTQSGSTIAPTVTYHIDSGSDVSDTVEFFVWVEGGHSISYSYQNPVTSGSQQFWLYSVTPASPQTVSSAITITGYYLELPFNAVTSSSLCPLSNDQFKLLFIQDMQNPGTYRLTASNPGQFYYNVFYIGTPGETVSLTITIPALFVTQGAMPVHIYSSVSYSGNCFGASGEFAAYAEKIVGLSGGTISLEDIPIPSSGLVYVTVHLDFGYKITPGFTPDGILNAYLGATKTIPNNGEYEFSYTNGVSHSATVRNVNDFKKIPGFGGIVTDEFGDPVPGVTVTVEVGGKTLTATTNADGFYLIVYKTGKEQSYTIDAGAHGSASGTIKANKFVVNNLSET